MTACGRFPQPGSAMSAAAFEKFTAQYLEISVDS
jgi:hypothetical protein